MVPSEQTWRRTGLLKKKKITFSLPQRFHISAHLPAESRETGTSTETEWHNQHKPPVSCSVWIKWWTPVTVLDPHGQTSRMRLFLIRFIRTRRCFIMEHEKRDRTSGGRCILAPRWWNTAPLGLMGALWPIHPNYRGAQGGPNPPRPLLGKYLSHSVAYISINIYFHEQTAFYSDHWLTADSYMSAQPHNWYLAASFNTPVQPCSYLPIIQCFISHQCFFYIHLIEELSLYCPPQQCNNTAVLAATSDPSFTCRKVLRKIRIPVGRRPLKPCDTIPKPKINRFTIYN